MWTNIWDTLKALVVYGERLTWVEKRLEELEREQDSTNDRLMASVLKLEILAEREKWREEKSQHSAEVERLKLAHEQTKLENERLRLELERERERRQLPPATEKSSDDHSHS
jgi:hypothetical protein